MGEELRAELEELGSKLDDVQEALDEVRASLTWTAASGNGPADTVVMHLFDDIDEGLERHMLAGCGMREKCRSVFTDFLQDKARYVKGERVPVNFLQNAKSELEEIRESTPYGKKCDRCFSEVTGLLEREVALFRSVDRDREGKDFEPLELPVGHLVEGFLKPLANEKRMEILKATSTGGRTFSELSEITGVRGGNLQFHLDKLEKSGLVVQGRKGGEYTANERGCAVLETLNRARQYLDL